MDKISQLLQILLLFFGVVLTLFMAYDVGYKLNIDHDYYKKEKKISYLQDLNYAQENLDKILTKMEADSLNKEVQKMIEEELK